MPIRGTLPASVKLLIWLGVAGFMVTALGILLASPDDNWFDDLWLELAKAGVRLLAVGLLGGALTYAWKSLSISRDKQAERRAKIRSELVDLFSLYNDVKGVRRSLRSLGLDPKYNQRINDPPTPEDGRFTEAQARGFHQQMLALNSLQLGFEAKKRQFEQTDFLDTETGKVVSELSGIEHHLNGVLSVWEKRGWTIEPGVPIKPISDGLLPLFRSSIFKANISVPLRDITALINKYAFEEPSSATKELVRRLDAEVDNGDK